MAFKKPTVVLADDHEPMLTKLSNLLRPDYNVVAAVGNGALAVQAAIEYQPDLVLLDIAMPQMNGLDACRKIRELGVPTRIIFLSAQINEDYIELARFLSAGYILKNHLHSDLLRAIKEALAGRLFYSMIPVTKPLS